MEIKFTSSDDYRKALTAKESKRIERLYKDIAKRIKKKIETLPNTSSSQLREQYLKELSKQIKTELKDIEKNLLESLPKDMMSVSEKTLDSVDNVMKNLGLGIKVGYSNVPKDVVESIASGKVYSSEWSLSKALWNNSAKATADINSIIAAGVAENASIYDIAKDLEKYVNPSAVKPWDWSKKYPRTNKKVDYNAQRLASTLISHAHQKSFEETTKDNPFFTGYKWITSNSHVEACEICRARATENSYGLGSGIFPKDSLPLDHPNGLCTFGVVTEKSMDEITDDIAAWFKGENDSLDGYAKSLGYDIKNKITSEGRFIEVYGKSKKKPKSWLNDIPKEQKEIAKALKEKSGKTWEQWYIDNIFEGDLEKLRKVPKKSKEVFNKDVWMKSYHSNKKVQESYENDWKDFWRDIKNSEGVLKDQLKSFHTYTTGAYEEINDYLRGLNRVLGHEKTIKNIKGFMESNNAVLKEELYVRRGSNYSSLKHLLGLKERTTHVVILENKENYIGKIGNEKAFMSTTPFNDKDDTFDNGVEYIIKLPKGARGSYIAKISEFEKEKEFLLDSNSKFIIESIEDISENTINENTIRVYMSLII